MEPRSMSCLPRIVDVASRIGAFWQPSIHALLFSSGSEPCGLVFLTVLSDSGKSPVRKYAKNQLTAAGHFYCTV